MAVPIVMPKLGMVMSEGTVAKWTKAAGEVVAQGDVIAEIETEKINYDLEATDAGIFHPVVVEGAVVPVDGLVGYILADGEPVPEAPPQPAAPTTAPEPIRRRAPAAPRPAGAPVRSTPGARRLAAKLGVDIAEVAPTGPGGRVVDDDVRAYAEQQEAAKAPAVPLGLPTPSKIAPLKGLRESIATNMRASLTSTAQLSYFLEVDVTDAQQRRRKASKETGKTITMADVLVKACAEALKRVPALNTVLSNGNVLYFDEINIGLAVALDDGLIVPVVRNVGEKDISQIADQTRDLSTRAREGTLLPDDVVGGTFTISVLGTVDGFTPILNPGQSALLGVGRSAEKPVVRSGEIVVREMMTLSLTADHQVIDGAIAASFLRRLQQMVERPAALFR